jgi:putative spermidine/putrescine transport system permease protein
MAVTTAPDVGVSGPILTADGKPLKASLQKSLRKNKLRATLLVAPTFIFLLFTFIIPVLSLMMNSVDDTYINDVLPRTFAEFDKWDGNDLPPESMYKAMFTDVVEADGLQIGKGSTRMNYAESGWKSLLKKSRRNFSKIVKNDANFAGPYKEAMIKVDKRWGNINYWKSLSVMRSPYTLGYYWNAIDRKYDINKSVVMQPESRQVYVTFWMRTLLVSMLVTLFCVILGYPVAHLLATLPLRYSNILMICVLMPFWTSLLVRIVAWMIMLQQQGVVNDSLVAVGILADDNRLAMMYNFTGTLIVMTQVLLPFMILPIYSVMKTISPVYMKAAQNLGATPRWAFLKVYMPQTLPGVGAGVILVFIVAIGYYITPELVGGKDGQLIGNQIAYHLKQSLNWGLASAMGVLLLAAILILYWVYDKIVGIDNMRMG